jgi:hypothetical protein
MNKEIQDSLNELRLFTTRQNTIVNDLETYLKAMNAECRSADDYYIKTLELHEARAALQKIVGKQLAEILVLEAKLVDQQKTIKVYQDVADAIVARGKALEEQIEVLKKNQKKPRKKRVTLRVTLTKEERLAIANKWIEGLK